MNANMERESFANILRGVASLSVLIAHYIGVFNLLRGGYAGFEPLAESPLPYWDAVRFYIPMFNYGPFWVALFFLISGFAIALMVARLSEYEHWKTAFITGRVFRIWPTYLIGLSITIMAFYIAGIATGIGYHPDFLKVVVQLVTLMDLLGDGVVWTLGIEIKFYALCVMFSASILYGRFALFVGLSLLAIIEMLFGQTHPLLEAILFAPEYIVFMLAGVAFALHYRGVYKNRELVGMAVASYLVFAVCSVPELRFNYLLALIVFAAMYLGRERIQSNRFFDFFANISYPLYVSHAAMGYVGMRMMIGGGVPPELALFIQTTTALLVGWTIHRYVETPTHILGKRKTKKTLNYFNRKTVSA